MAGWALERVVGPTAPWLGQLTVDGLKPSVDERQLREFADAFGLPAPLVVKTREPGGIDSRHTYRSRSGATPALSDPSNGIDAPVAHGSVTIGVVLRNAGCYQSQLSAAFALLSDNYGALARRGLHHGAVAVGRGQRQREEQGEIAGHHLSCDRWAGLLVIWVISLPNKAARCLGSKQDNNSNGEIIVP